MSNKQREPSIISHNDDLLCVDLDCSDPPEDISLTSTSLTVREGDLITPVFCDGHSDPPPSVSWWRHQLEVTGEATLDWSEAVTRQEAGLYQCRVENKHGLVTVSFSLNILHKPTCRFHPFYP